jgi:hypothetical protein
LGGDVFPPHLSIGLCVGIYGGTAPFCCNGMHVLRNLLRTSRVVRVFLVLSLVVGKVLGQRYRRCISADAAILILIFLLPQGGTVRRSRDDDSEDEEGGGFLRYVYLKVCGGVDGGLIC